MSRLTLGLFWSSRIVAVSDQDLAVMTGAADDSGDFGMNEFVDEHARALPVPGPRFQSNQSVSLFSPVAFWPSFESATSLTWCEVPPVWRFQNGLDPGMLAGIVVEMVEFRCPFVELD